MILLIPIIVGIIVYKAIKPTCEVWGESIREYHSRPKEACAKELLEDLGFELEKGEV